MKTSLSLLLRQGAIALGVLVLAGPLWSQSSGNGNTRATIPSAAKLARFGQVATAAEAKPLIERYYAEQEALFQERRAAIVRMKGKPPAEQLQIMQELVTQQRDRRQAQRELEARVAAMLKQERETQLAAKQAAARR